MNKSHFKQLGIVALALGVAVGCASKPAEPEKPAGPSAATTQAINDAQAVMNQATAPCTDTGNAADLLAQAQTAAQAGDDQKAQDLAGQAKSAATQALNDCWQTQASQQMDEAKSYTNLTADQMARLNDAEAAMASGDYKRAYDTLSALNAELRAATMSYTVVRGDSLWKISGKSEVYGNPYEWPLIYKANSDKIKDADLIYPGQNFDVKQHPMQSDVDAAVQHAKNRGAWSVGPVEQSDQDYLAH
ncbi:MAG: LysM peptidoglycan-binding domain-containing protein [Gammaproteobacteria bacterium]|jgi:nucleoid-associated protein YgaU